MKELKSNIYQSVKLQRLYHLLAKFIVIYLLITIHSKSIAQSPQKIRSSDDTIQKLSAWRIVGPFNSPLKKITQLDSLKSVTQNRGGILKDTFYRKGEGRISLDVLLSTRKKALAYASCEVLSELDQEVLVFIEVDDKIKIWVNDDDAIAVQKHTTNGPVAKKARLKKGVNKIFIEIENNGRDWWFDLGILGDKRTVELVLSMKRVPPKNIITSGYGPRTQLTNWRVLGPFRNSLENIEDFDLLKATSYINRQSIVDTIYHQGKPGNSLYALFNTAESNRVAYAVCNVFSDKDQEIVLDLRVDDELRLWINNREILRSPADRIAIKNVHFKKGNNQVIAEVRNEYLDWWFEIAVSGVDYVRDNMLLPGYCLSSLNPIMSRGDSLMIAVADTNFIPVRNIPKIEIFDCENKFIYSGKIDVGNREKLPLPQLPSGAYRYKLYTDLDTLSEYFCYGSLDSIYTPVKLMNYGKNYYKNLLPYIGRFDRLISDYKKSPSTLLGKKVAHCLYKIKEIEMAAQKKSAAYLHASGLNLKSFTSVVDYGDEYYMLYVPEKMAGSGKLLPLVVMVPFVTNNHPFYTGTIIANYERVTYISRFADRYGFAVLFPSSRIYKWYNQTPITTKSITESIQDACKYYNFDKDRIFLYGECSGALFALQTAIRRPDLFASIAIRGAELSTVNLEETESSGSVSNNIFSLTENLYDKPIFAFHSSLDHAATIDFSNKFVDSVKSNGGTIYYNNLPGLIKDYDMTSYSEPEVINATFSLFGNVRPSSSSGIKKMATYGIYNDTLYGTFVKEKLMPGKATVSYQLKRNTLELQTTNVKELIIDLQKLNFENPKKIEIQHNGKTALKNINYRLDKNLIFLHSTEPHSGKEIYKAGANHGPLNKVFLKTFAIVRPSKQSVKSNLLIAAIDSVWFTEYRNHVLVVDHNSIDSAKRVGLNLIYLMDSIQQVPKRLLHSAGIKFDAGILTIDSESFHGAKFTYGFYFNDKNKRDDMYIGSDGSNTPLEMLKNTLVYGGWYDFEIWDGEMPFYQRNYQNDILQYK